MKRRLPPAGNRRHVFGTEGLRRGLSDTLVTPGEPETGVPVEMVWKET
jgi:hypothetical protein